jgi:hypothetical protein
MIRFWLAGALAISVAAGAVLARTGIVRTTDGQSYQGEVREEEETVIVVSHGVETILRRDNIDSIEYPESVEQQFEQRMQQLADNDVQGRLQLAQWAFQRREYDLSLRAIESALQIDPNSREAVDMQTQVRSQIRLERQQRRQAEERAAARANDQPEAAPREAQPGQREGIRARRERRLLSNDDINRIRQKELQRIDGRIRIRFENNIVRRFAEETKQNLRAFTALPQVEQAIQIIDYKDDPQGRFARDVRILDDPASLREYKMQIQPAILANCATSNCHGSAAGGDFILHTPADSDAVSYTNFYVLQSYTQTPQNEAPGVFGGGELRMIDRNRGESSLLVQYGLPRDTVQHGHPNVRNLRPMMRNRDDAQYRRIVSWMNMSLRPVTPEYGIDFDIGRMRQEAPPAPEQPGEADQGAPPEEPARQAPQEQPPQAPTPQSPAPAPDEDENQYRQPQ